MMNAIIIIFFIYSFLGWILEVSIEFTYNHKFLNRGFLTLPFIPIYGFACIVFTEIPIFLNKNIFITFLLASLFATIFEYIVSFLMEKLFHLRWWDYSDKAFNINGRVCLQGFLLFGFLATCIIKYINPFLEILVTKVNNNILIIIDTFLVIITVIDFYNNYFRVKRIKNKKRIKGDGTKEIKKMSKNSF